MTSVLCSRTCLSRSVVFLCFGGDFSFLFFIKWCAANSSDIHVNHTFVSIGGFGVKTVVSFLFMRPHTLLQGGQNKQLYQRRWRPHLFSHFFFSFLGPRLLLAPVCEAGNGTKRWRADENVSVRCHRAPSEMLFTRRWPTCLCTYALSYLQPFHHLV